MHYLQKENTGRFSFSFPPFKAAVHRDPEAGGFIFRLWWNGRTLLSETWEGIGEDCALNRAWAMMENLADDMGNFRNILALVDNLLLEKEER